MAKVVSDVRSWVADRAWGALDLVTIEGASARLHWTDRPYHWHVNDGTELFVVLDGEVDMHVRSNGREEVIRLSPSDLFVAEPGDAHMAVPVGEARILVVEKAGSE